MDQVIPFVAEQALNIENRVIYEPISLFSSGNWFVYIIVRSD